MNIDNKRKLSLKILTNKSKSYSLYDFEEEVKTDDDVVDFCAFLDQYFTGKNSKILSYDVDTGQLKIHNSLLYQITNYILALKHNEFEQYSAIVCKLLGFKEFYATKRSGDEGIDFIALESIDKYRIDYQKYAIGQSKKYTDNLVGVSEVRELAGSIFLFKNKEFSSSKKIYDKFGLKSFTPTSVYFITSNFFSPPSERLCRESHILPLDIIDISLITLTGIEKNIIKWKKSKNIFNSKAAQKDISNVKIDFEEEKSE